MTALPVASDRNPQRALSASLVRSVNLRLSLEPDTTKASQRNSRHGCVGPTARLQPRRDIVTPAVVGCKPS